MQYPIFDSEFFDVREWVDERTWNELGPNAASLIDPRIVRVADCLRRLCGAPIVVNNWHFRKKGEPKYDSSGFRAIWDKTGGKLSQHRRGAAADFKCKTMKPIQMQQLILQNAPMFQEAGLTTMENIFFTVSWLHCDTRILTGDWLARARPFLIVNP